MQIEYCLGENSIHQRNTMCFKGLNACELQTLLTLKCHDRYLFRLNRKAVVAHNDPLIKGSLRTLTIYHVCDGSFTAFLQSERYTSIRAEILRFFPQMYDDITGAENAVKEQEAELEMIQQAEESCAKTYGESHRGLGFWEQSMLSPLCICAVNNAFWSSDVIFRPETPHSEPAVSCVI